MLPYILAAVGGYLIGLSQKKDALQMAKGGMTDLEKYHNENGPYITEMELDEYFQKSVDGYKKEDFFNVAENMGYEYDEDSDQYLKMAKGGKVENELYVAEFRKGEWTVKDKKNPKGNYTLSSKKENAENVRQFLIDNPSRLKYYRTNEYAKGGKTKSKKWIQDALGGDEGSLRRTAKRKGLLKGDENLSMTDLKKLQKMGGKTAKRAHLAETLRKFDDGGMTDYYEDLRVYVQGVGTIYKGNSLSEATDVFDEYYANNPHAEMVMVDEKYGDEIKWANTSSTDDNDD